MAVLLPGFSATIAQFGIDDEGFGSILLLDGTQLLAFVNSSLPFIENKYKTRKVNIFIRRR